MHKYEGDVCVLQCSCMRCRCYSWGCVKERRSALYSFFYSVSYSSNFATFLQCILLF